MKRRGPLEQAYHDKVWGDFFVETGRMFYWLTWFCAFCLVMEVVTSVLSVFAP